VINLVFTALSTTTQVSLSFHHPKKKETNKSIIDALRAAALKCAFEQIYYVAGNCGSVVESDFYTQLQKLDVQDGKKDRLFADHVTRVCEAPHDWVILSNDLIGFYYS